MFQNTHPHPKSPSQLTFLFKLNMTVITMTVNDATMDIIIWIQDLPS